MLDLVLGLAGPERLCQPTPEAVQPGVGHLENPADVLRLVGVEEGRRLSGVAVTGIGANTVSLEESEGDEAIKEVEDRA